MFYYVFISGTENNVKYNVCFSFSAVLTKLLSLDQKPISKRSGTDLTVAFFFTVPGNTFFFCKEKCEDKNVLVDTDGNSVTKDRYSIEYRDDAFTEGTVFVSITQLKESDSGRYQCGLDRRFFPDSYYDFVVSVTDGEYLSYLS